MPLHALRLLVCSRECRVITVPPAEWNWALGESEVRAKGPYRRVKVADEPTSSLNNGREADRESLGTNKPLIKTK